jgi:hypothetical protein
MSPEGLGVRGQTTKVGKQRFRIKHEFKYADELDNILSDNE